MQSTLLRTRNLLLLAGTCYYTSDFWYDYYKFHYVPVPDVSKRYGKQSFALITEATSEVGVEFAELLAKQGFNLILISKNAKKLENFSKFINKTYSVHTLPLKMDLSQNIEYEMKIFSTQSKGLDISIIVNNSSVNGNLKFEELGFDEINNITRLNCSNSAKIVYSMIPRLKQRTNKSAIINVSTLLAIRPMNCLSFYSATNAFNHYLSIALADDLGSTIDVLSFLPAIFEADQEEPSSLLVSPKEAVKECVKDLGFKIMTYGHYKSTLTAYMMGLFPKSFMSRIFEKT